MDIEGDLKPLRRFRARVRMLWHDDCLYIGAELEEPHVWGSLTEHECVIYHDNDFKILLDPNGACQYYVELELTVLNTTWDLMLTRPYRAGGQRINGWELHGIRTAILIDGTLNDPWDTDRRWTSEIAIPWSSLEDVTGRNLPPHDGDQWRHQLLTRRVAPPGRRGALPARPGHAGGQPALVGNGRDRHASLRALGSASLFRPRVGPPAPPPAP